ncbi:MAG: hypothetical protein KGZ96_15080 [Clostridia bacterium]|nr:hypothetical protein [Clostridia bacterium]
MEIPHVYGALAGFSILEDRDDHILTAIKVTPLSIHGLLAIRLVLVFLLAFVAAVYVMWFSAIGPLLLGNIMAISFLVALGAPSLSSPLSPYSLWMPRSCFLPLLLAFGRPKLLAASSGERECYS